MAAYLDVVYIRFPFCMVHFRFVHAVKNCVHIQRFLEMFMRPCSNGHYRIVPVSNAVPSEA